MSIRSLVRRHVQSSAYDLDDADESLYEYVRKDGFVPSHYSDELAARYPLDRPTTLYRGLRFDDESRMQEFIGAISTGKITADRMTSWSPHKATAFQFAVTAPAFQINRQLQKLIADNPGEVMLGDGGVILEIKAKKGDGIDVSKFEHKAENEVLLLPGRYNVKIVKVIRRFRDMLKGKDINEVIKSLIANSEWENLLKDGKTIEGYDTGGLFNYILNFRTHDLSQASKVSMSKVMDSGSNGQYDIRIEENLSSKGTDVIVTVGPSLGMVSVGFFGKPDDLHKIRDLKHIVKLVDSMVYELIETMNSNPDAILGFYGGSGSRLHQLVKYGSRQAQQAYKTMQKDIFGSRYHSLNKPGAKTPEEVQKFTDDMLKTLRSITSYYKEKT